MKRSIYLTVLVFQLLSTVSIYPQFSKVLFKKYLNLDWYSERRVVALGDQNGDGYDDFILHEARWADTFKVYFGGEVVDTVNTMDFQIPVREKIAVDINHDGVKDILAQSYDHQKLYVFYGGTVLDTIADMILSYPEGVSTAYAATMLNIGDFNGDGFDDILFMDYYLPNSNVQKSVFYFCSTYPQFDLLPEMVISSDTARNITLLGVTSGDLDGDGESDLMIYRWIGATTSANVSMQIIPGNSNWDTTAVQTFYQKDHTFELQYMRILGDINKDNKADVMLHSYGNYYPHWEDMSIIYGSIPLDTVPDVGINTQDMGYYSERTFIVGDVNGDGYNDIIQEVAVFFSYPVMKIFLGGSNMNNHNLPVLTMGGSSDFYGGLIGRVGDVNGDGADDFLIGTASPSGGISSIFGFCEIRSGDTSIVVNEIEDGNEGEKPEGYELYDPYPNPFNPEINIKYSIGKESDVTIKIYDILGKEVEKILEEKSVRKGEYSITYNTERRKISSGIYFLELTSLNDGKQIYKQTKKINLIK